jgi:uncharacterized membrane protein SpoIIM required for sporulation
MKQSTFEHLHQPQWQALEHWLDTLEKRRKTTNNNEVTEFPKLYRQICTHLALARDRHYTPYLVERLNLLVLRGHQQLYQTQGRLGDKIINFIALDFPTWVRQEYPVVVFASLLFVGSLITMFIAVQFKPDLVYSLMDADQVSQMEQMYNPTAESLGRNREADSDFLMFGFYIRHNITIGFQTFAGGILFGLGTLFFLVFNGLIIGTVAGHLTHIGYSVPFYSFVVGHSAFELTAIVLAGAAGLKLGIALIAPGRVTRLQSLRNAATHSIRLVYGVIGMLLLAAFVEAFWSSNTTFEPLVKYTVGGLLWLTVISYFVWVGRHHAN